MNKLSTCSICHKNYQDNGCRICGKCGEKIVDDFSSFVKKKAPGPMIEQPPEE